MSKQHCRMLQVERFARQSRMLLRHCCRFWQQRRTSFSRNFFLSTKSKQIEQFISTLSKRRNFATMSKQRSNLSKEPFDLYHLTMSLWWSCFHVVAGVNGALAINMAEVEGSCGANGRAQPRLKSWGDQGLGLNTGALAPPLQPHAQPQAGLEMGVWGGRAYYCEGPGVSPPENFWTLRC